MPEFIADTDGMVAGSDWSDLSEFVQGYIECILFTETASGISMVAWNDPENVEAVAEGYADGCIPTDTGFGDLYPDSLARIIADCHEFQREAAKPLSIALGTVLPGYTVGDGTLPDSVRPARDYDAAAAGRDFWYTRNGHGVGFWDRGLEQIGRDLSSIAKNFGESYVHFGEGPDSPTGYGFLYVD